MTRFVGEPSLEKASVTQSRGIENLARRPAPAVPITVGDIPYIVCKVIGAGQAFTPGGSNIVWNVNVNNFAGYFTPILFGGSDYYQIRLLKDGLYSVSVDVALTATFVFDWAMSIYTVDAGAGSWYHRATKGQYSNVVGYPNADIEWTFRMDGTGGSNRVVEFRFINFHATSTANAQSNGTFIELRYLGATTMTGRNRDANPG